VVVNVPANDFDPDENPNTDVIEEPLTVTIESQPSHGTASLEVAARFSILPDRPSLSPTNLPIA
jgi:hypothetical protein